MNRSLQKRRETASAAMTQTLVAIFGCFVLLTIAAFAADPGWWSQNGTGTHPAVMTEQVVTNGGVVTTNFVPNPNAVVTQGQLKQFTARAVDELNAHLTGGAGTNLNSMVSNWAEDYQTNHYGATNIKPSDYTAITVGQLKYVGNRVWSQLVTKGYTNAVPTWLAPQTNSDTSLAVIGQLKSVFNFDITSALPTAAPVIVNNGPISGSINVPFSYSVSASNSPTSYSANGLPPGLSFNSSTGAVTGTPSVAGVYNVYFTATNGIGSGTAFIVFNILQSSSVPFIESSLSFYAQAGVAFTYQITASNSPTLFSAAGLPSGLAINSSTGVISGTVTTVGTDTITLSASNSSGMGIATLLVTVGSGSSGAQGPAITSSLTATGTSGQSFSYQITASNSPTNYAAFDLPAGLSLNTSSGLISGTPTSGGTSIIGLSATGAGGTVSAALTLSVANAAPTITSASTGTATVGQNFDYAIAAINNPSSYFASSSLPSGLILDTTSGIIYGIPTSTGTSTITLGATNSTGTGTATLTLTVIPAAPPVITSPNIAYATIGQSFSYTIAASNFPTAFGESGALPAGLTYSAGVISGTPSSVGSTSVVVTATNSLGQASSPLLLAVANSTTNVVSTTFQAGVSPAPSYESSSAGLAYDPGNLYDTSGPSGILAVGAGFYDRQATEADRVLLGFDLSELPSNTQIISASLTMTDSGASHLANGFTVEVHPAVSSFDPNLATWLDASDQTGTGTLTTTTSVLSTLNISTADSGTYTWPTSANFAGAVQSAVGGTLDLLLVSPQAESTGTVENVALDSETASTAAKRPSLAITYSSALPPLITNLNPVTPISVASGTAFSYAVTAMGSTGTYTATGLPAGLSINPTTGVISGTATETGTFQVTISTSNANGPGSVSFTMNVGSVPVISGTLTANGTANTPCTPYTIEASNSPTSYGASGLPPGLSCDPQAGVISGTPLSTGTYTVSLTAANTYGTGTATLDLTIAQGLPVIYGPLPPLELIQNVPFEDYEYQITTNTQTTGFAFSGFPGSVNISVNIYDDVTGTVTASGTFTGLVAASNSAGTGSAVPLTLVVAPMPTPAIAPQTVVCEIGSSFNYQIQASIGTVSSSSYPPAPINYSLSGNLPTWLSLNATSGQITGTPTGTITGLTTYTGTITASDSAGSSTAPLTINLFPSGPGITSPLSEFAQVGNPFSYSVQSNQSLSAASISGSVPGLVISSGSISGTPTTAGTYTLTLSATNYNNETATAPFVLTVEPSENSTAAAQVGVPFIYAIPDSANPTNFQAINLPPGLSLNPTYGVISGTPQSADVVPVQLTITDALGTETGTLLLTIGANPGDTQARFQQGLSPTATYTTPSAIIETDSANAATEGETFSPGQVLTVGQITATASSRALLAFDLSSLPANATITSAQLVMNPVGAGSSGAPMTVELHQAGVPFLPSSASWTDNNVYQPTLLGSVSLNPSSLSATSTLTGTAAFTSAVQQAYGQGNPLYLMLVAPAVEGQSTPDYAGFTANASTASQNPQLLVTYIMAGSNGAPVITSAAVVTGTVNVPFNYAITATGNPQSFGATNLPPGFSCSTSSGVISGTGTTVGSTLATVSATNASGTGTKTVAINIDSSTPATSLQIIGGTNQVGIPQSFLAQPLVVQALAGGGPLTHALVTYSVPPNQGAFALSPTGTATTSSMTVVTDANGEATVYFQCPQTLGESTVVANAGVAQPVSLIETTAANTSTTGDSLAVLSVISGEGQSGPAGQSIPFVVQATNATGQPISGLVLSLAVVSGYGGSIGSSTATTDSNGLATISMGLTGASGTIDRISCAPAVNASQSMVYLTATTSSSTGPSGPTPSGGTPPNQAGLDTGLNSQSIVLAVTGNTSDATIANLNWTYNSSAVDHYIIQREDPSIPNQQGWVTLGTTSSTGTTYPDPGRFALVNYKYQVIAVDSGGKQSSPSNTCSYELPVIKTFWAKDLGGVYNDGEDEGNGYWPEGDGVFPPYPSPGNEALGWLKVGSGDLALYSGYYDYDGYEYYADSGAGSYQSDGYYENDYNPANKSSFGDSSDDYLIDIGGLAFYLMDPYITGGGWSYIDAQYGFTAFPCSSPQTIKWFEMFAPYDDENGNYVHSPPSIYKELNWTTTGGASTPYTIKPEANPAIDNFPGANRGKSPPMGVYYLLPAEQIEASDSSGNLIKSAQNNTTGTLTLGSPGTFNFTNAQYGQIGYDYEDFSFNNLSYAILYQISVSDSGGSFIVSSPATGPIKGSLTLQEGNDVDNYEGFASGVFYGWEGGFTVSANPNNPPETGATVTITVKETDTNGDNFGTDSVTYTYQAPPPSNSDLSIPIDEASGPKYRKIALNGLPMADEKPQQSAESDQEKEETYVDALTLGLHHSTTDVYMPVSGSDFSVSARRDFRSQVWNSRNGLLPHEQPDLPFGVCWSSNLAPNIKFTHNSDPKSTTPDQAIVTDETGAVHTFYRWYANGQPQFFPMPTAKNEAQVPNLETLTENSSVNPVSYTFTKKYGAKLTYQTTMSQGVPWQQTISNDRLLGSLYTTSYGFARLVQATDRVGNTVNYQFANSTDLVPITITVANQPGIKLYIQQEPIATILGNSNLGGSVISAVWDANGNKTTYQYVAAPGDADAVTLNTVTTPDGKVTTYLCSDQTEADKTPHASTDPGSTWTYADLASIADPLGNAYTFTYNLDHSKLNYMNNPSLYTGYYVQSGSPRNIATVVMPNNTGTATFTNNSCVYITANPAGGLTVNGPRVNTVKDATGFTRTYTFGNPDVVPLPSFPQPSNNVCESKIVAFQSLTIGYGSLGSESFQFDINAAMALKQIKDFSGNITTFAHTDTWTAPNTYSTIVSGATLNGFYDDPTSQTDALGQVKNFVYDPATRIMTDSTQLNLDNSIHDHTHYDIDSLGRRTTEKIYGSTGTLIQETDFAYGNASYPGFMTQKTVDKLDNAGSWETSLVTAYAPDANGRVAKETVDPGGLNLVTTYTYDANGNKLTAIDPKGNTTWFSYDSRNRLITVTYADGSQKQMVYDARGNKIEDVDENGLMTVYQYDSLNRLSSQTRKMNGASADLVTSYTYDSVNDKLTTVDPNGNTTTMSYDNLQRVTTIQDALGDQTQFTYGANSGGNAFDSSSFKPTHTIDPRGLATDITYDALYRPLSKAVQYSVGQAPSTTSTQYDAVGNPTLVKDPLLNQTSTTFDALNRPLVTTYADGTTTQQAYTSTGFKWQVTDENGHVTQTQYDAAGRPTEVIGAAVNNGHGTQASPVTQTIYDADGNVAETINPLGNKWDYVYDARNRKVQELEPAVADASNGNTVSRPTLSWQYDPGGRITAVTDARGNTTSTVYDPANRVTDVNQAAIAGNTNGSVTGTPNTHTTYDLDGNVKTVTDPNGHITTNGYDALNRLLTSTDALSITVTNTYDQVGNKLSVRDGNSNTTSFTYDGLNRLLTTADPANNTTTFTYNALNKTQRTDALGQVTHYLYDPRNRLLTVNYTPNTAANSQRNYVYDNAGNLLSVGEPQETAANVGYTYDALNRVATETSQGETHTYTLDLAGNRLQTVYGGTGRTITSTYDVLNRLSTMAETARSTSYGYDLNGNIAKKTAPNGDAEAYTFDALNRATVESAQTSAAASLFSYQYGYDLVGNVLSVAETYPSGLSNRTTTNTYDAINRLTQEAVSGSAPNSTTAYTYDNANNRLTKTVTGTGATTIHYFYNVLNQLTSYNNGTRNVALTYDANGNRATRVVVGGSDAGTDTSSYDFENRLIGLVKGTAGGAGTYAYQYDYRTRRIVRDESNAGGVVTDLVFSGGTSVQEYSGSISGANLTVEYIRGSDYGGGVGGILYTLRGGTPSYTHENRRGDVVAKTSSTGALTYQAQYEGFGQQTATNGSTLDQQKSNSKDTDPTNLVCEGFRYRDLETGMFISRDPAGFVDGPNEYTYVSQNPWTKFDPEGLADEEVVGSTKDDIIETGAGLRDPDFDENGEPIFGAAEARGESPPSEEQPSPKVGNGPGEIPPINLGPSLLPSQGPPKTEDEIAWEVAKQMEAEKSKTPGTETQKQETDENKEKTGDSTPPTPQKPAAKPGPKTDPTAPHNAEISAQGQALEDDGNTIIAGGGRTKERLVPTPGGNKEGRRPDIIYQTPSGETRGRNVGKVDANGNPVTREQKALNDLNGPGGLPTDFVPYNSKKG